MTTHPRRSGVRTYAPANQTRRGQAHKLIALAFTGLTFAASQAQSLNTQSAAQVIEDGLRRQAERERAQREADASKADNLHAGKRAVNLPMLPDEQPCFVVTEVALVGSDAWRFTWLSASISPLLGRCLGVQGLSRIAAYGDAQLVANGYVTSRVSVEPQNLADGRVELRLHAGRIELIRMVDVDALGNQVEQNKGTWRNAFPTRDGDLLDARDLEQGVEQMNRLRSQTVTTIISPGSGPDASIVTIERRVGDWRERMHGAITLDNSGSRPLGRAQAIASIALDNPLGLNDLIALYAQTTAKGPRSNRRSEGWGLQYSVPLGYSTLSLSASHSHFAQLVHLPTVPHETSGDLDAAELRLQRIVWRSDSAKAGVYAAVSTRRSTAFLDDTELLSQRHKTTMLETGFSFRQLYLDNATFELDINMRRGVSWLGAHDELAVDPQDASERLTLRPTLWSVNAGVALPLRLTPDEGSREFQYAGTLRAQTTSRRILPIDQLAIGSRYTVRGFDGDSVLVAESGWVARNELSTAAGIGRAHGVVYLGVDAGRVWGPSDTALPGHKLLGAALGLRVRVMNLHFDIALATPLSKPDGFKTGRWNLYASASHVF